MEDVTI